MDGTRPVTSRRVFLAGFSTLAGIIPLAGLRVADGAELALIERYY